MIRTDGLTKVYGDVTAVDGLTIGVPAGSVVGLLGPNGAGKTTLLRLFLGLVRPTSGAVRVLGRDLPADAVAIRRRVALVPESKAVYSGVSAAEFLRFYTASFRDADLAGALGLLERWGVDASMSADTLSPGSRSKILLAGALARGAELLLLDEPSAGLDPGAIEDLWTSLMRRVGGPDGAGVVLSTHRIEDVERVCDRVMVLDRGRLLLNGEIDDLRAHWRLLLLRTRGGGRDFELEVGSIPGIVRVRDRAGVVEVTTSAWNAALRERIVAVVHDAEILEVREMGLREIYLTVVGHAR